MLLNTPWIIGFSVLDPIVEARGGPEALHQVFLDRLARSLAAGHVPGGMIEFHRVARAHERHQWIVKSMREPMHRALTELVIAWEETEDVDSTELGA